MASIIDKLNNKELITDQVIATDLLVTAKAAVRSYAVAITETASPSLHKTLKAQLDEAIEAHHKIATYMIEREMYHAYDLEEQIEHDLKKADVALDMPTS
ncbi:spore coat protein [Alkalicoccobacillus gibsonii]|uniref:spore coat protein n=1 Tax=Alkalicoccobacillus gibsonii TaxID=79881 RepID=UPI003F7BD43A